MLRDIGGFGDKGSYKIPFVEIPKKAPCASSEEMTLSNQALYYRLTADLNPLHASPQVATMAGFPQPILHGLCSFGFTARAIYQKYCDNDPMRIKTFASRFTSHVFPGETLIVEMHKNGNTIAFETKTKERKTTVLKGYMEIRDAAKL